MFEDMILLNVLQLIDPRLPQYTKEYYQLKLGDRRIMDIRTDIFNKIKKFTAELDSAEQLNSLRLQTSLSAAATAQNSATLAAFNTAKNFHGRGRGRGIPQPARRLFCKLCYDNGKGKTTYLSHNNRDSNCPTKIKLNMIINEALPPEVIEEEERDKVELEEETTVNTDQVVKNTLSITHIQSPGLRVIQPVPTQLLTLSDSNGITIHLELDSAATVNFITVNEAKAHNFKLIPNSQSSKLGDGDTVIHACGEINTILYRDSVPLQFQALVCPKLYCPAIGGTLFIKTWN